VDISNNCSAARRARLIRSLAAACILPKVAFCGEACSLALLPAACVCPCLEALGGLEEGGDSTVLSAAERPAYGPSLCDHSCTPSYTRLPAIRRVLMGPSLPIVLEEPRSLTMNPCLSWCLSRGRSRAFVGSDPEPNTQGRDGPAKI